MEGMWRLQPDVNGQEHICVSGNEVDEQVVYDLGCRWDGGYCTTTDNREAGTWLCPQGTMQRLENGQNTSPISTGWLWIGGAVLIGVIALGGWLVWSGYDEREEKEELLEALEARSYR